MYWTSLSDFLAMGGHAGFVWPSFGLALAVLLGLGLQSRARMKAAERENAEARRDLRGEGGSREAQA
ncbi:MAG TPA: heme exporter protein CcmD [Ferrovibrio sp.]|uniref:heme exporter protein CcmD n=1 Tax=Ferrovibrio sp. TaxID=1917215 RepID=UPI002B4ACFF4|nr:heme exporter protein CcmD [Ferrovibrio sp.]HLT78482.1 heme exporter protein CcmD [Ferrovibrio sp.]